MASKTKIKRTALFLASCLLASCLPLQAKPRHWYKSGKLWTGEALILAALGANAVSGCHAGRYGDDIVRYYNGPQELPFFQSYHQSCAQIKEQTAALAAAYTLGHIGLYRATDNSHSRALHFLGAFGMPTVAGAIYGTQARKNYGNLN